MVLSPLADPVVAAIFADADSSGLAAASLVGAILAEDGVRVGQVVSVTPQRHYSKPGERGCRIDVEIVTTEKEHIIVEIQNFIDHTILKRNLFSASRIFTASVPPGSTFTEMAAAMPKIVSINLLDFNLRPNCDDYLQPVKLLYVKPPHTVALDKFSIYNIQLPCFRKLEPDFSNSLDCWLYAIDKAAQDMKTLKEVLDMTPELQAFATHDSGFQQYCQQYDRVAADPATLDEYYRWVNEQMRQAGMWEGAWLQGREEGRIQTLRTLIEAKLAKGKSRTQIIDELELTPADATLLDGF
jgi:hypothetical protein